MTFEELFTQSARAYFEGEDAWENYDKASKRKYDKSFFDNLESKFSTVKGEKKDAD